MNSFFGPEHVVVFSVLLSFNTHGVDAQHFLLPLYQLSFSGSLTRSRHGAVISHSGLTHQSFPLAGNRRAFVSSTSTATATAPNWTLR